MTQENNTTLHWLIEIQLPIFSAKFSLFFSSFFVQGGEKEVVDNPTGMCL